jgi:zinc/manganese transport system substrate-binding protein
MRAVLSLVSVAVLVSAAGACDDDNGSEGGSARPQLVVTTNIIGDVVRQVVGDEADVEVIMPLGSDPHDFEPSARQAEAMAEADILVVNGAGFEAGMSEVIESAEAAGAPLFAFAEAVELLELDGMDDPHIWTDPTRMATATEAFAEQVGDVEGVDPEVIEAQAASYVTDLEGLDRGIEDLMAGIVDAERKLVTNHEVLGYFADRYDFEVIGAVIPSVTTSAEASASEITELAELIRDEGVPAIFAETTQSSRLARALARETGADVEVVELYTESLGDQGSGAETYLDMTQTNAERIAAALA